VLPCAEYYKRQGFPLKKIVAFGAARDYSDLLVFNLLLAADVCSRP
jgi:ribosome production factor 1